MRRACATGHAPGAPGGDVHCTDPGGPSAGSRPPIPSSVATPRRRSAPGPDAPMPPTRIPAGSSQFRPGRTATPHRGSRDRPARVRSPVGPAVRRAEIARRRGRLHPREQRVRPDAAAPHVVRRDPPFGARWSTCTWRDACGSPSSTQSRVYSTTSPPAIWCWRRLAEAHGSSGGGRCWRGSREQGAGVLVRRHSELLGERVPQALGGGRRSVLLARRWWAAMSADQDADRDRALL